MFFYRFLYICVVLDLYDFHPCVLLNVIKYKLVLKYSLSHITLPLAVYVMEKYSQNMNTRVPSEPIFLLIHEFEKKTIHSLNGCRRPL